MRELRIMSFGFKHGVPTNAHFVFDVRRIRNPHNVPSLREKTGEHRDVRGHIMADQLAHDTVAAIEHLLATMLPGTKGDEGRVHVAVGCYGGRHRSVVIAEELASRLKRLHVPIVLGHREKIAGRWATF